MYLFFLILFCQSTLALKYNDKCTDKCNLPGLNCVSNQCKCDRASRLFWTGVRCGICPQNWTITETLCVTYHDTNMAWDQATTACRNIKSELISFRNQDIVPVMYQIITKQKVNDSDRIIGWTSASGNNLSGSGRYEWMDRSLKPFDKKSDWWCKKSNKDALGYDHPHDDPTVLDDPTHGKEKCVSFRRGFTTTQITCLDDRHCHLQFPFVCEKSESTADKYVPPLVQPDAQCKVNPIIMILLLVTILLLLTALLCALLYFFKGRNIKRPPVPKASVTNFSEMVIDEPPPPQQSPSESAHTALNEVIPENSGINLETQKAKRGGFSKQQFDELE